MPPCSCTLGTIAVASELLLGLLISCVWQASCGEEVGDLWLLLSLELDIFWWPSFGKTSDTILYLRCEHRREKNSMPCHEISHVNWDWNLIITKTFALQQDHYEFHTKILSFYPFWQLTRHSIFNESTLFHKFLYNSTFLTLLFRLFCRKWVRLDKTKNVFL